MSNIRNIRFWLVVAFLSAFSIFGIYMGVEVLIFIIKFFANPTATAAAYFPDLPALPATDASTTTDWEGVIGGAAVTLLLIAWSIGAIGFFGYRLAEVIWHTTMEILDEILKKLGCQHSARYLVRQFRNGNFSSCWIQFPLQLH